MRGTSITAGRPGACRQDLDAPAATTRSRIFWYVSLMIGPFSHRAPPRATAGLGVVPNVGTRRGPRASPDRSVPFALLARRHRRLGAQHARAAHRPDASRLVRRDGLPGFARATAARVRAARRGARLSVL